MEVKFGFLLLPKFTLTTFSAMIDMIRLANKGERHPSIDCTWGVFSMEPFAAVPSNCGVSVQANEPLSALQDFDYIVVIGGNYEQGNYVRSALPQRLSQAHKQGSTIIGVCRGVLALAAAGLLEGHKCCVSWFNAPLIKQAYPDMKVDSTHFFLEDDNVITCAGGIGALNLTAHLLERRMGRAYARNSLQTLLLEQSTRSQNMQPLKNVVAPSLDPRLHSAIKLIEQALSDPPSVGSLAKHAGISRRQLERLFLEETGYSPAEFARRLRLNAALHLLIRGEKSASEIAFDCGFCDAGHMSRSFRTAFGTSIAAVQSGTNLQLVPLGLRRA